MPWRECRKVDERLRFVARLLEGEKMAVLCREFDISRKTGYKIFTRYQRCGLEGLKDRSRRSYRQANRLPFQIESLILGYKQEHPSWGAPKIREKLGDWISGSVCRPSALCMQCSIGMAWSPEAAEFATEPKARCSPSPRIPTISGVPTTRASSCSQTSGTAIR